MASPTPMLDRMLEVKERSQAIGDFLEWLQTCELEICERHRHTTECVGDNNYHMCGVYPNGAWVPAMLPIEQTLAQYFEINLEQAERERRDLLDRLRQEPHP